MNYKFDDVTQEIREKNWERVRKQYRDAMNAPRIVRWFRAMRWKYQSNEIFQGLIDALWIGFGLGIICAVILGLSLFSNYTGS